MRRRSCRFLSAAPCEREQRHDRHDQPEHQRDRHRGSKPALRAFDADPADVVSQNVRRARRPALRDQRHRLEHLNRVDDRDDGREEQRAPQERQGHEDEALQRTGPVELGRLIERCRDLSKPRDSQDREIADLLPDIEKHDRAERGCRPDHTRRLCSASARRCPPWLRRRRPTC